MPDRDLVLLETVKTHRARLVAAFLSGELAERRVVTDNLRRLLGGLVLAAVVCAACVGFSFVSAQLGSQAEQERIQQGLGPATGPVYASDTFDRTVPTGWGDADRGGSWQAVGPADAETVDGGAARIRLDDPTGYRGGYLPGLQEDRSDLTVTVRPTPAPTAGGVTVAVQGRRISSTQDYRAMIRLGTGGATTITLVRVSAADQADGRVQQISDAVSTRGSGDSGDRVPPVSVRMQVVGANPTTVRAKVWSAAGAEPQDWTVTAQDSTPDLQRPGTVGLLARRADPAERSDIAVTDLIARRVP